MRKTFCDKCGKEITEDVTMVFNHELCPECANAVNIFITRSPRTSTMDALRNFCENFGKNCDECPFYDLDGWEDCKLKNVPSNWPLEEETYSKLLDYKVKHPDWRKEY